MSARDLSEATPPPRGERWFLKLYPREWRERYGAELAELVGDKTLSIASSIDLIAGAIDARFSKGTKMPAILKTACLTRTAPLSRADHLRGAAAMIGCSLLLLAAGILSANAGWPETAEFFKGLSFPASFAVMSHFLYLRKQSVAVKWVITGGTLTFLVIIAIVATKL